MNECTVALNALSFNFLWKEGKILKSSINKVCLRNFGNMKISEGALDLGTTDYAVALDPSYTMLEFDSLRVLPVDTGLCDITRNMLQCGLKCK